MTREEFQRAVYHGKKSPMLNIAVAIYDKHDDSDSFMARVHFVINNKRHKVSDEIYYESKSIEEIRSSLSGLVDKIELPKILSHDKSLVEMYA